MSTPRHAILIAGMHRSGTSAFARVANLLGAELGPGLVPAAPGNPRGYWEERTVVELNEECLQFFGLSWDNPAPLPTGWLESSWMTSWCERLADYIHEAHGSGSLIVIKDPRLCRLLPAWLKVLNSLEITPHMVLAFRDPREVARSLMRRDGLSDTQAKLLWLVHLLDAEQASRGLSRAFSSYSSLLDDWQALVQRLEDQLGHKWPTTIPNAQPQIEAFLNSGMRHKSPEERSGADVDATSLLAELACAFAQSSCKGPIVPAECWDEARHSLEKLLRSKRDGKEESSAAPVAPQPATASTSGLWEPAEIISEVIQARLYFRQASQTASEYGHVAAVVSTGTKPMHAAFSLPGDSAIDFIRFDPAMRRGIYRIFEIRVNGHALSPDEVKLSAVHERLLPGDHGALICFVSDDDDPHIELDMRALCVSGEKPLLVEFTFECDSLLDRLQREMARQERRLSDNISQVQRTQKHTNAALIRNESSLCEMQEELSSMMATVDLARSRDDARLQFELVARGWGYPDSRQIHSPQTTSVVRNTSLRPVLLQHLQLLAPNPDSNAIWWRTTEQDAFFQFELPGSAPLSAGWYLLRLNCADVSKDSLFPKLEIDYGDDCGVYERIDLQVSAGMCSQLLLRCKQPALGLRFRPSPDAHVEFLLSPPQLRRLTRIEALLRLGLPWLRTMRSHGDGWGEIWRKGWQALMRNSP